MSRLFPDETPAEKEARRQKMFEGVTEPEIALAMQAIMDRDDRAEANRPAHLPDCPPWCRFREIYPHQDHDYDSYDEAGSVYSRFHVTGQREYAYVSLEEHQQDGIVTFGALHVFAGGDEDDGALSAAQARQRAQALLAAAELLDLIGGEQA